MNNFISISEMSKSLSITSRTLRYWESQGLFSSHRDAQSDGVYMIGKLLFAFISLRC